MPERDPKTGRFVSTKGTSTPPTPAAASSASAPSPWYRQAWAWLLAVGALVIGFLVLNLNRGQNQLANTISPAPTVTTTIRSGTVALPESVMLAPQGAWQTDGRFRAHDVVAPSGYDNIIFDGQLAVDQAHVFLIFDGRVPEVTFLQGTIYAVRGDSLAIARRIAREKHSRQPDLEIQVRDCRRGGNKLVEEISPAN